MQNKPNFLKDKTNATPFAEKDYENKSNCKLCENKPNTNPIKPNLLNAQMNVNKVLTKYYENVPLHRRGENKPNQTQFQTFCWGCRTEKIMFCNRLNRKCQIDN